MLLLIKVSLTRLAFQKSKQPLNKYCNGWKYALFVVQASTSCLKKKDLIYLQAEAVLVCWYAVQIQGRCERLPAKWHCSMKWETTTSYVIRQLTELQSDSTVSGSWELRSTVIMQFVNICCRGHWCHRILIFPSCGFNYCVFSNLGVEAEGSVRGFRFSSKEKDVSL